MNGEVHVGSIQPLNGSGGRFVVWFTVLTELGEEITGGSCPGVVFAAWALCTDGWMGGHFVFGGCVGAVL